MKVFMNNTAVHYDQTYYSWQSSIGEFGGWANRTKFEKHIESHHSVIDFGCGGGFLLKGLACNGKIGIEVNETARRSAAALGIEALESASNILDDWADVIISNHALEHCERPLDELRALYPKLKSKGKVIFVVPSETITYSFKPGDINQHLYTWSPMNLGNLFTRVGFRVDECVPLFHKWPPHYAKIARLGGRPLFDLCCKIYAHWERTSYQVRLVAHKP
jgi:SAM-dependent methyltransferase